MLEPSQECTSDGVVCSFLFSPPDQPCGPESFEKMKTFHEPNDNGTWSAGHHCGLRDWRGLEGEKHTQNPWKNTSFFSLVRGSWNLEVSWRSEQCFLLFNQNQVATYYFNTRLLVSSSRVQYLLDWAETSINSHA